MFGYRADGRRLKKMDPIIRITPYLMPMRCDAQVFLQSKLDYEKMSRYIVSKSREGQKITFMQIIVAAYVRTVSRHPEVNRYIFNKQYYARNNCSVSYVVLKDPQNPESSEATVRVQFDPSDTLFDVRDRMDHAVEVSRATEDGDFVIRLAKIVLGVPGLTTLVVNAYRLLDAAASYLQLRQCQPVYRHGDRDKRSVYGTGRKGPDAPLDAAGTGRGRTRLLRSTLFLFPVGPAAFYLQSGGTGGSAGESRVRRGRGVPRTEDQQKAGIRSGFFSFCKPGTDGSRETCLRQTRHPRNPVPAGIREGPGRAYGPGPGGIPFR